MLLIFNAIAPSTGNTLVKHSNYRDHYPAIHANTDWATLEPYIRRATRDFLLPWIGSPLYVDLAAKYQTEATLTDAQAETLLLMQDAVASYAAYLALPALNVQLTNLGAQQTSDREGTSAPPSQWAFKNARWAALSEADNALEKLLQQLNAQVKAETAYYDIWKNAEAAKLGASDFILELAELSEYLGFQDSIRTYRELIRYVKQAEQHHLLPVLGDEFYAELKAAVLTRNLTAEQTAILPKVRAVAAYWGLYTAADFLTLQIDPEGFRSVSATDDMNSRNATTNTTQAQAVQAIKSGAEQHGLTAKRNLQNFLLINADDYPTFKESAVYENYTPTVTYYESPDQRGAVFL